MKVKLTTSIKPPKTTLKRAVKAAAKSGGVVLGSRPVKTRLGLKPATKFSLRTGAVSYRVLPAKVDLIYGSDQAEHDRRKAAAKQHGKTIRVGDEDLQFGPRKR